MKLNLVSSPSAAPTTHDRNSLSHFLNIAQNSHTDPPQKSSSSLRANNFHPLEKILGKKEKQRWKIRINIREKLSIFSCRNSLHSKKKCLILTLHFFFFISFLTQERKVESEKEKKRFSHERERKNFHREKFPSVKKSSSYRVSRFSVSLLFAVFGKTFIRAEKSSEDSVWGLCAIIIEISKCHDRDWHARDRALKDLLFFLWWWKIFPLRAHLGKKTEKFLCHFHTPCTIECVWRCGWTVKSVKVNDYRKSAASGEEKWRENLWSNEFDRHTIQCS